MKQKQAFDYFANDYDATFTHARIGSIQRKQVWRRLQPYLKPSMDILELNCGTGEDGLRLARAGHRVVATDISGAMIDVGKQKKKAVKDAVDLHFQRIGFKELGRELPGEQFKLVFSNFGGLNCISPDETRQLAADLANLLSAGGQLFLVYMSKQCGWEQIYYRLKKDKEKASRRSHTGPCQVWLGEGPLEVWYYDPNMLEQLFKPYFRNIAQYPIGLFVPPSYLEAFFASHPGLLATLDRMDRWFGWPVFANYADHFVITFEKCE